MKYPLNSMLPRLNSLSISSDTNWQPFSHDVGESDEGIQVGEWLDESVGGQRRLSFKPTRPLKEADSDLIDWLEIHLSNFGDVTISENGEIKVIYTEGVHTRGYLNRSAGCITPFKRTNILRRALL